MACDLTGERDPRAGELRDGLLLALGEVRQQALDSCLKGISHSI